MADLNSIEQIASSNDRLMFNWVNSVRQSVYDLRNSIATINQQIIDFNDKIINAFKISSVSGLTVSVAGGNIKNNNTVSTVSPIQLTLLDNSTNYIFIDGTNIIKTATSKPETIYDIGYVVTLSGIITQIVNYPIFEIKQTPNFDDYATVEYANSKTWQLIASGRKINVQGLPNRDTYYTVTYNEIEGIGLNTGGIFTVPQDGKYVIHMITRVDTSSPISNPNLSVKMSFFVNDVQEVLLSQLESARGDATLNGSNAIPLILATGNIIRPTIYITEGVSVRIREISNIAIWKVP